jgi:hypothetical protein
LKLGRSVASILRDDSIPWTTSTFLFIDRI